MPISTVQHWSNKSNTASTAASAAALPAAGNAVVVRAWGGASATPAPACTDNQTGNTYRADKVVYEGRNGWCAVWCLAAVSGSSGTFTVTVAESNSAFIAVACEEVAGLATAAPAAAYVSSVAAGTGSSTHAPGPITTTDANVYVAAVMEDQSAQNPESFTSPSGFTSLLKDQNGAADNCGEAMGRVLTATGTSDPQWTNCDGTVPYSAIQVVYKAAAAGAAAAHLLGTLGVGG